MLIDALDHVQLAMPPGGEDLAVAFYEGVLGIPRVSKPAELAARRGCWFERGALRVHLGVQDDFVPATKAHPAFAVIDLDDLASSLDRAGVEVRRVDGPEGPQVYAEDPFGNRLEFRPPRAAPGLPAGSVWAANAARSAGGDDLEAAFAFIGELDRLRAVERRSFVLGGLRRENSAEHSWHVALMAVILAPYADDEVDLDRVVRMLLVHDVVEIDAGDTFVYDDDGHADKDSRERAAANRLFGLLPGSCGLALRELWDEFEDGVTAESRFARALDRLAPLTLNVTAGGLPWRRAGITIDRIRRINATVAAGSATLGSVVDALLDRVETDGLLR